MPRKVLCRDPPSVVYHGPKHGCAGRSRGCRRLEGAHFFGTTLPMPAAAATVPSLGPADDFDSGMKTR